MVVASIIAAIFVATIFAICLVKYSLKNKTKKEGNNIDKTV